MDAFDLPVFQSHAIAAVSITQIIMKNAMYKIGIPEVASFDDALSWVIACAGGLFPNVSVAAVVVAPLAVIAQHAPIPNTITNTTKIIATRFAIISSGTLNLQTGNTFPVPLSFALDEVTS